MTPKTARIEIRCTPKEKKQIIKLAKQQNKKIGPYMLARSLYTGS